MQSAELMRTLDEKFIADPAAYAAMRPVGTIIVEGAPLRTPEGELDRDAVRAVVARAVALFPPARQRLREMPLGLTTPAWVAAEPDLDYHLRFHDEPTEAELAALLGGALNGELALDRPLWSILAAPLSDGDVAIILQLHHALGDGLFGLRFVDALTANDPVDASVIPEAEELSSPRTALGIWRIAFREWRSAHPGLGAQWREYWRKPVVRRVRRTGGRLLRSRRFARAVPAPARRHAIRVLDYAEAKAAARDAGASIHDLLVTAALEAVGELLGDPQPALLVPISRRAGTGGEQRNHISMIRVAASSDREDLVASVAEQVATGVAGEAPALPARPDWPGYASFLPWRPRPRWFGAGAVRSVSLWPVLAPDDRLGVFGSLHNGRFSIAVATESGLDADALLERVHERLLTPRGAVAVGTPAEAIREAS
ncbi:wax ester/triacylglycerol synthase domain-containing protein [Protaetiibacter larvae]|uniref:O-acyltransferase WSD1-like N-terminal domain-containing protein n=1 Tax=Protaetiibacter larvae TaxID=2592654 RepID=A0A5C1Y824_9MICO|nr:wax ester/triacylglycerol synthase domain-containing protein [Protaetiibacter larvae]QEO10253.1 hypothetical protein FLP23_09690 [Protaetiibacter larvae]